MSEICGFFREMMDDPDNPIPRLIYADWLEEQGDPTRADFIRLQCESAPTWGGINAAELRRVFGSWKILRDLGERAREGELWHSNHEQWTEVLRDLLEQMQCRNFIASDRDLLADEVLFGAPGSPRLYFCRGLVDQLTCSVRAEPFLFHVEEVYRHCVLRELSLHSATDEDVQVLVSRPEMRAVKDLHLPGDRIWLHPGHSVIAQGELSDHALELLASCPWLRRVKYLSIKHQSRVTLQGIRRLAKSPYLENLKVLGASGTRALPSTITAHNVYSRRRFREQFDPEQAERIQELFSQELFIH